MKDKITESFIELGSAGAGYDIALEISNKIQKLYNDNEFDVCVFIYNQFKSAMTQTVTHQQLIPLELNNKESENGNKEISNSLFKL